MASQLKRPVRLSARDREELLRLTTTGVRPASAIRRARVLLALDTSVGEPDPKEVVAARLGETFVHDLGPGDAVEPEERHRTDLTERLLLRTLFGRHAVTGEVEARLIALACSAPPAGHARWSLRLLEKHVELTEDIPNLDHSTIGRVLKKHNCALT